MPAERGLVERLQQVRHRPLTAEGLLEEEEPRADHQQHDGNADERGAALLPGGADLLGLLFPHRFLGLLYVGGPLVEGAAHTTAAGGRRFPAQPGEGGLGALQLGLCRRGLDQLPVPLLRMLQHQLDLHFPEVGCQEHGAVLGDVGQEQLQHLCPLLQGLHPVVEVAVVLALEFVVPGGQPAAVFRGLRQPVLLLLEFHVLLAQPLHRRAVIVLVDVRAQAVHGAGHVVQRGGEVALLFGLLGTTGQLVAGGSGLVEAHAHPLDLLQQVGAGVTRLVDEGLQQPQPIQPVDEGLHGSDRQRCGFQLLPCSVDQVPGH